MALSPIVARDGNNAAQSMASMLDAVNSINYPQVGTDSTQVTYRCAANFTPITTSAVTLISIKGSATKTVRIKRIGIGGVATANSGQVIQLLRTSALGSGGTAVTPTASLLDKGPSASYPAATAVVNHYTTGAQTGGTSTGNGPLSMQLLNLAVVTTPTLGNGWLQSFFPEGGAPIGSAIVLRGTSDFLEIQNVTPTNFATGGVVSYFIEFVEDAS